MPTPKDGESQDEFHSRCMSKLVGDEGYDSDQANAICYKYWENKNENKRRRDMRTIRIKQEMKIPGTDYVLEAGDRIQVENKKNSKLKESFFPASEIDDAKELVVNQIIGPNKGNEYSAGLAFIQELDAAIGDQLDDDAMIAFYKGMQVGLKGMA